MSQWRGCDSVGGGCVWVKVFEGECPEAHFLRQMLACPTSALAAFCLSWCPALIGVLVEDAGAQAPVARGYVTKEGTPMSAGVA